MMTRLGEPATTHPAVSPPRVILEIACGQEPWGRIVLELDQEKAPVSVENFLRYVDEGFYDGTIFHRVIRTYLIQGGGYVSPTELKRDGLHRPIRNEARNGLKNLRGTIGMARNRSPNSATSQFYINVLDNPNLDYPSRDGWGYCVFGKVLEGMQVVDRIRDVKTQRHPAVNADTSPSSPIDPPRVERAYRVGGAVTRPAEARPPESEVEEAPDHVPEPIPEEAPDEPKPNRAD
jgi:peptidyl-prolyl cis-trans isomerase A (cyclophilin A)